MPRGGDLLVSIRAEPRTFNSLTVPDYTTEVLASLTQAKLIRINRATDEVEPWLAESWTRSSDGLRYVIKRELQMIPTIDRIMNEIAMTEVEACRKMSPSWLLVL